jgi:hypothetical protein
MIHELGHIIEGEDRYVKDMVQMFLIHRVRDEVPVPMDSVVPGVGYGPEELGRKDNFDRILSKSSAYYTGRDYGSGGSEILAMGMENISKRPKEFFEKDPEWAKFMISVLQYKTAHEAHRKSKGD